MHCVVLRVVHLLSFGQELNNDRLKSLRNRLGSSLMMEKLWLFLIRVRFEYVLVLRDSAEPQA